LEVAIGSDSDRRNKTKQLLLFIFVIFIEFPICAGDLYYRKIEGGKYIIFAI
jgi:hypothetical protein